MTSMPVEIPGLGDKTSPLARPRLVERPDWLSPAVFPFEVRALDVAGAQLTYTDEGAGPILLFVPGSPMWSFMFRATITALRSRFRCIAFDLPGLGLSRAPLVAGRAFARNADWLQAFVRALDLDRFTLAVHATAGPSALEVAVRERERISGLAITNSFAWPFTDVPKFRTFVRILNSRPVAFATVRLELLPRIAAHFGRRTRPFTADERAAILGPFRRQEPRRHLQNLLLGLRTEDAFFAALGPRMRALAHIPTLLLYGAHDNGYKLGFVDRWKSLLPRYEVVLLDRSDHFAPEDQPEEYTTALDGWWHHNVGESA